MATKAKTPDRTEFPETVLKFLSVDRQAGYDQDVLAKSLSATQQFSATSVQQR